MNRTASITLAVTASLLVARAASADTKSWTAVKKVIGKGDAAVVSIDLATLRSTAAFKAGLQLFLDSEEEAKQVFDIIKADCGIDVTTALSDITIVLQDHGDRPLMAFGLDGLDEKKVIGCLGIVAGKMTGMPGVTLKGKKIGKMTEYSVKGEKKKLYAAWLAKDVLVFSDDANDKKKLASRVAGKGATGDLKTVLAKASPSAPFWFAVAQKEKEDGRTILGGYAKFELAGPLFKGAGAVMLASPAEATSLATEGNEALASAKREIAGKKMVELTRAVSTITMAASGNEVVITGSVADKDVATIVPQLDKVF